MGAVDPFQTSEALAYDLHIATIDGDSMEPLLLTGDRILVDTSKHIGDHSRPIIEASRLYLLVGYSAASRVITTATTSRHPDGVPRRS
jgi:signal peptidase I